MTVGFVHLDRGSARHRVLAAGLVASVRQAMPSVPIVQLTNHETAPIDSVVQLRRLDLPSPMALATLLAYAQCEGEWLFVDTDVIVQRDVRAVFAEAFDIAVASRDGTLKAKEVGTNFLARNPYNKGAVFSRCPAFWAAAVDRARQLSPGRQDWMGDQQAMCQVIADGGFDVHVLPADYNYAPHSREDDVRSRAIVHYKGDRKAWLLERAA